MHKNKAGNSTAAADQERLLRSSAVHTARNLQTLTMALNRLLLLPLLRIVPRGPSCY